ncbi:MAG TPA: hypothetical protein VIP09_02620 [Dehalococcoidia bacterium]
MKSKTAWTDAGHIIDIAHAQRIGTLVCVESFACEDEGEVFEFTAGISYVAADHDVVRQFPENFAESTRSTDVRDGVPIPDVEQSDSPPAPDLSGLLVCIRGFGFEDPDTGYRRYVRYGHEFVTPDDWLAPYYPEHFVAVEAVVPSDCIPGLPLPDE